MVRAFFKATSSLLGGQFLVASFFKATSSLLGGQFLVASVGLIRNPSLRITNWRNKNVTSIAFMVAVIF